MDFDGLMVLRVFVAVLFILFLAGLGAGGDS